MPHGAELHADLEHLDYIDHACIDHLGQWENQRSAKGAEVRVEWDELMQKYHERNSFRARDLSTAM